MASPGDRRRSRARRRRRLGRRASAPAWRAKVENGRAWTRRWDPSNRCQTTSPPPPSTAATCGTVAPWPAAESVGRRDRPPAVDTVRAWIRVNVPSDRVQVTIPLPPGPTATSARTAFCPAAERVSIVPSTPSLGDRPPLGDGVGPVRARPGRVGPAEVVDADRRGSRVASPRREVPDRPEGAGGGDRASLRSGIRPVGPDPRGVALAARRDVHLRLRSARRRPTRAGAPDPGARLRGSPVRTPAGCRRSTGTRRRSHRRRRRPRPAERRRRRRPARGRERVRARRRQRSGERGRPRGPRAGSRRRSRPRRRRPRPAG